MSKYKFAIYKRKVDSIQSALDSEIVVEVTAASFCGTRIYLKFELELAGKAPHFNKIELTPSAGWSEDEHKGFIKCHFGFLEDRQLKIAVNELKLKLNGQHLSNNLPMSWNEFVREFYNWYSNDLEALIKIELEMFNKYAKNSSN